MKLLGCIVDHGISNEELEEELLVLGGTFLISKIPQILKTQNLIVIGKYQFCAQYDNCSDILKIEILDTVDVALIKTRIQKWISERLHPYFFKYQVLQKTLVTENDTDWANDFFKSVSDVELLQTFTEKLISMKTCSKVQIGKLGDLDKFDYVIPFEKFTIGCVCGDNFNSFRFCTAISIVKKLFTSEKIENLFVESLPFPTVLISDSGELLLYNSKFLKLNLMPLKCLELKSDDLIEINTTIYRVVRSCNLFVFRTDWRNAFSSTELGIVTSSIAHEMNNPIAGILAAIALMMTDDNIESDVKDALHDMKACGERCRELVQLFLNFAKGNDPCLVSVQQAVAQTINLLRFRMIDSGIKLDVVFEKKEFFSGRINAMLCYLFFDQLLTAFARHCLVSGDNKKNLKVEVLENMNGLQINLPLPLEIEYTKLLRHLLHNDDILMHKSNELSYIFQTKCVV